MDDTRYECYLGYVLLCFSSSHTAWPWANSYGYILQSGLLEFDKDIVSQSTVNEIKITLPFTVKDLSIVFSMVIMSLLGALYLDIVLCFESTRLVLQVQWIEPLKLGEVEAKGNRSLATNRVG